MRKLLPYSAFTLLLLLAPLGAQVSNPSIISVSSAPSGACTAGLPNQQVVSTGTQYSCQSGTWAAIGGSGGGNVSNTGTPTSGQIAQWTSATVIQGLATTGSGSAVLSTSPTLVTPALGVPTSATLTNAIGLPLTTGVTGNLPNANLASQTANTVLGALTATTPSGLALPSCSGASNALIWTTGTGFGCNTITGGSSGPTFKGYVGVPLSASVTSITTGSLSGISVGDLLVVYCRSNSATTLTGGVTSSPSETWNALTHVSEASTGDTQISWAIAGTGAGHTATCTQSSAGTNMAAAFLDYSGTGTTLNTSASTTGVAGGSYPFPSNTTYASGAITTSQRTLVVFCAAVSSAGSGFLGGWINGNAATIRAADSASGIGAQSSSIGCEDVTAPIAGSITGYTGYSSSQHFANTIAAFNY